MASWSYAGPEQESQRHLVRLHNAPTLACHCHDLVLGLQFDNDSHCWSLILQ
jgi:hypothetical protein